MTRPTRREIFSRLEDLEEIVDPDSKPDESGDEWGINFVGSDGETMYSVSLADETRGTNVDP